jgi:pyruvate formate lyase activating enzyme
MLTPISDCQRAYPQETDSQRTDPRGIVLEIQRMSTEDGPGLRTTVFLKGCPLKCGWCHNPESISPSPQLVWNAAGCLGCNTCVNICPQGALTAGPTAIVIDRDKCRGCGACARECPTMSMVLLGETWRAGDLVSELAKDDAYFLKSKGGVTVSGGEATLQRRFTHEVLKGLQARGIHTALDTCGMCSFACLETLVPRTDLLLFDIKEIDARQHEKFIGFSNERILENLKQLPGLLAAFKTDLWIRTPIVPGATDRRETIRSIGEFIVNHLEARVSRWELCAFNNLGKEKYTRLGKEWAYGNALLVERKKMEALYQEALNTGLGNDIVFWSGSVRD